MAMTQLPLDFKEFLKLFNSHQVENLLVGGYALVEDMWIRMIYSIFENLTSPKIDEERIKG